LTSEEEESNNSIKIIALRTIGDVETQYGPPADRYGSV